MEQKVANARIVAGILGILLIIALVVVWNESQTIRSLNGANSQNITATADTVRQDCSSTDPTTHAKCGDDLQNLSDLLAQFSKTLPTPSGMPANAVPVGTVSGGQFTPTK